MCSLPGSAQIIERAAAGDQRAWEEIVRQHHGRLRGIAAGYRLAPSESDDAMQMTWLALVRAIGTIESGDRVGGWLTTTMRRNCLRLLQRRRNEQLTETLEATIADPSIDVEAELLRTERNDLLWEAVDRLPAQRAQLVRTLYFDGGHSYKDAAAALSMPLGAIGPNRQRALRRIAQILADGGTPIDDLQASA